MSARAGVVARWAAWHTSRETVICTECGETVQAGRPCPECGQVAGPGGGWPMVGMLAAVVDLAGGETRLVVAERRTPSESWVATRAVPVDDEAIRMLRRQAHQPPAGSWDSRRPQPLSDRLSGWLAAHGDSGDASVTASWSRSHEQVVSLW